MLVVHISGIGIISLKKMAMCPQEEDCGVHLSYQKLNTLLYFTSQSSLFMALKSGMHQQILRGRWVLGYLNI